jgi:putative Mg2+ transporter-C (MgtC) family protein
MLARVAIAALLGAGIGFEREQRGQVAGMRTHGLVACGAAIFTLAGAYGFPGVHRGPNVDPMRVAAQIASGIGFIGGGAILREGATVRGVTTAASLWAAAALGLAAGAGLWRAATIGLAVLLLVLVGLGRLTRRYGHHLGSARRVISLEYERGHGTLGPTLDALRAAGATLDDLALDDASNGHVGLRRAEVFVRTSHPEALDRALTEIERLEEVVSVRAHDAPT